MPAASRYPPVTPLLFSMSFWPTLTAWKFMPKMVGTLVVLVPRWFLPSISLRIAFDLQSVVALNVLEAVGPGGQVRALYRGSLAQEMPVGVVTPGRADHVGVDFRRVEVVERARTDARGDGGVRGVLVGPCRVSASLRESR